MRWSCNMVHSHCGQDWSPHMSFIWKGSQIWALQLKCWFKSKTSIQEYRNANTKVILKLVHEFYGACFQVQCEEVRINHLTLLLVMTMPYACWFLWRANHIEDFKWRRHFQFGVAFWRVFLREVNTLKGQITFEGHWRLQSWTLHSHFTLCSRARDYTKAAYRTLMVLWPLDESQGSSLLQGHGSWLMCEVALNLTTLLLNR